MAGTPLFASFRLLDRSASARRQNATSSLPDFVRHDKACTIVQSLHHGRSARRHRRQAAFLIQPLGRTRNIYVAGTPLFASFRLLDRSASARRQNATSSLPDFVRHDKACTIVQSLRHGRSARRHRRQAAFLIQPLGRTRNIYVAGAPLFASFRLLDRSASARRQNATSFLPDLVRHDKIYTGSRSFHHARAAQPYRR
ncbi:hypothetical protein [Bradyrhizobium sp. USDA 10063]